MTVSFEQIPSNIKTPGQFVEVDSSQATDGSGERPHKAVIFGYRLGGGAASDGSLVTLSTGAAPVNVPVLVTRESDAIAAAGESSMAAQAAAAFLSTNNQTPTYLVCLDDPATSPATGTVTFTASSPLAGTVNVYIGGTRYQVEVSTSATASTLAALLAAAVNTDSGASVTATVAVGVVTLTAKHPGIEANGIDVRVNYRETDRIPSGVTAVVSPMSGGTGSVSLATAIANLGGERYDTVVSGITEDAAIEALDAELTDRWGPMIDADGHLFTGFAGTQGATTTVLAGRNSFQHTIACVGQSPTLPWVAAADLAAVDAKQTQDDPARGRTGLRCKNVLAPARTDRWAQNERNAVLSLGGATIKPDASGNMVVERVTTTYLTNSQGAADPTWFDLSTKRTVSYLRWSWKNRMLRKFPRHKLADDGTNFDPGQAVVTPSTIRAEAVAWFSEMEGRGLVENLEQFTEFLVVERSEVDLNRIDSILPPNTINKFVVGATSMQPRL